MTKFFLGLVSKAFAVLTIYGLGRKSQQVNELKRDVKTGDQVNEILKEQRDNTITNVDDSDSMWDERQED